MKKLFTLFLFSPLFSSAQKSHGFFNVTADMYNYSKSDPSFGGSLEFGAKGKIVGLGMGFGITQFKDASSPYVPIFGEMCFYTNERRIRPVLQLRAGYGLFDNNVASVHEKGGLFLNPTLGILAPVKRSDFIIAAGYLHSEFNTNVNTGYFQAKTSSSMNGWNIKIGMRF